MIFHCFSTFETQETRPRFLGSPEIIFQLNFENLMFNYSNESIRPSYRSVISSFILGHWISSHLSHQISKVGTAECAERSAAPRCGVLDHPQGSVSSTSCLPLQAFPSLQFFASISVFIFLHRFWLSWKSSFPLLYPPHGLRFPTGQSA